VTPQPEDIFRGLADPTRRALFERLCREGEVSVATLTEGTGISQPAVSRHLKVLREAGLVEPRPDGRHIRYSARRDALAPLRDWTARMEAFWAARFDDLETLLDRMDQ